MTYHFEPIALGTFAFAQVVASSPPFDLTNIGFGGMLGFLVWWLTKEFSRKMDRNDDTMVKLAEKIDKLAEKIDSKG